MTLALLAAYLSVQLLLPLRHHLYPGNPNWTEQGHAFAWRMKLRDKDGTGQFFATTENPAETREIDPTQYLAGWQAAKMAAHPDLILQFAHHAARELQKAGAGRVQVHAVVKVSLNGRPRQLLVDPAVDLAATPRTLGAASWILPLTTPLPRR